jgi:hypothetical protein
MNFVNNPTGQPQSEQCHTHALTDRRRATRLTQKFVTQMTPWAPGHASVPFEVVIDNLSDSGVGVIHDQPLDVGLRHLLSIPRSSDGKAVTLEYLVVRCAHRGDGGYLIGLERAIARDSIDLPKKRVVSERTKLLLLLFGIFGLVIAAFAPL